MTGMTGMTGMKKDYCDDYNISILGLNERSDVISNIMNEDIIKQICLKEKEDEKEKSKFVIYCDETKEIELILIYKDDTGCDWNIPDQIPKKGKYGSVYTACCNSALSSDEKNEECDYVLKIDKNGYNCREVYTHLLLANFGIAPKLYEVWKIKSQARPASAARDMEDIGTIFIMKKLYRNLYDILLNDDLSTEYINKIYQDLMYKIDVLYSNNIKHNDLHLHNIMTDYGGALYFIDFGMSERFGSIKKEDYLRNQLEILGFQLSDESNTEKGNGVQDSKNNFKKLLNKIYLYIWTNF